MTENLSLSGGPRYSQERDLGLNDPLLLHVDVRLQANHALGDGLVNYPKELVAEIG